MKVGWTTVGQELHNGNVGSDLNLFLQLRQYRDVTTRRIGHVRTVLRSRGRRINDEWTILHRAARRWSERSRSGYWRLWLACSLLLRFFGRAAIMRAS